MSLRQNSAACGLALGIIIAVVAGASPAQTTSTAAQPGATIAPGAFEIRGLKGLYWDGIDKYYSAVNWMPAHGMNWLMLCYSAYPESASDWRKDYTPEHLAEMRELVTRAADRGVTICLSFNPGIWSKPPLVHSSEADYQTALRKVKDAHSIGINWIALCLDDINKALQPADKEKYGTLEAAQVAFTNRLWADMQKLSPDMKLIFCPSAYTTRHMREHEQYIKTIGNDLDPAIAIFWTGPEVVSKSITAADAATVEKWLQRQPFVWDNYPVNDMFGGSDRPWRPLLAPLEHRSGDLAGAVSGILFNPMKQWQASRIPLVSVADYLRDPAGYDPAREPARILAQYQGEEREAVELLLKYYGSAFVGDPGFPPGPNVADAEGGNTKNKKAEVARDLQRVKEILSNGSPEMKQLWDDVKETVEKDLSAALDG